jgi:hypothetical protein
VRDGPLRLMAEAPGIFMGCRQHENPKFARIPGVPSLPLPQGLRHPAAGCIDVVRPVGAGDEAESCAIS